jgi:hypothetical protein
MAWVTPEDGSSARLRAAGDGTVHMTAKATVTISADALVAALYACFPRPPASLDDQAASDLAAAELVFTGLDGLYQHASQITAAEQAGTVANPEWLTTCRQYVTSLLAGRKSAGGTPELTDAVWSILTEGPVGDGDD